MSTAGSTCPDLRTHVDRRFQGKVVVITGGGGGIGRAAALRLATEGARIAAVDVSKAALADTVAAVERAGGKAIAVEADVTRDDEVAHYVRTAQAELGPIDAFFNNAGILGETKPITEYSEEMFDRVIAINLKGVWLGLKHVGAAMRAQGGGAIVNTASIAGLRGTPNLVAYTASKHAVVGMTRTAALELSRHGIRVNAICPGPIETAMTEEMHGRLDPRRAGAARQKMTPTIPRRRYGAPEEVAALVAFLLSGEASYINGGLYTVDGAAMA
jgi:NAD(P)-dependent dehydrogenase (short-subunit alcohol dehydrogenase family)